LFMNKSRTVHEHINVYRRTQRTVTRSRRLTRISS